MGKKALPRSIQQRIYDLYPDNTYAEVREAIEREFDRSVSDHSIHKYGTVRGLRSRKSHDPPVTEDDAGDGLDLAPPAPPSRAKESETMTETNDEKDNEDAGEAGKNPYAGQRAQCDDCGAVYRIEPDDPGQFPCPNCQAPQVFA